MPWYISLLQTPLQSLAVGERWADSPLDSPLHDLVHYQARDSPIEDLIPGSAEGVEDRGGPDAGDGVRSILREAVVDDAFLR